MKRLTIAIFNTGIEYPPSLLITFQAILLLIAFDRIMRFYMLWPNLFDEFSPAVNRGIISVPRIYQALIF